MKSLITLKNELNEIENMSKSISYDPLMNLRLGVQIKIEVCDFLIFISDLRMDFLISNILCYFEKL